MAGETTVGSIVGFLRLDGDQFRREVQQAIAQLERLDGRNVDIDVTVDRTGAAAAQVAATSKAVDNLGSSSQRSGRHMRGLVTAIVALGPALVPLGAGAVALGAAFGGMGAAGVAAIFGIKSEMEEGTAVGDAYRSGLDSLKESFGGIAKVAAGRMLGDFESAVRDLNARTPELTSAIGDMSSAAGKAGAAVVSGLVSAFLALEPLMRDASAYVVDLTRRFQSAMSGPGIREFGDYVRTVFPQVMDAIESIVGAAGHLIAALAPLGMGTLSALRILSDIISALPVDVLSALAVAASSAFIGFKTWQGLQVIIGGVETALTRLGVQAGVAAGALRGLNIAAGIIGIAVAGLSILLSHNAEEQRRTEQATNDYADALRASNGVIDESIRQMTAKRLADQGVLEAARLLGISLPTVTDAALGNADALAKVNAVLADNKPGAIANAEQGRLVRAAELVRTALLGENAALDSGTQKQLDIAAATDATTASTTGAAGAAQLLADKYGVSVGTYQAAADSQQQIADKAAAATLQMQLENDAAGLLKQALDLLNGEALSSAQAQNSFDRAMLAVGNSTRDAKGHIDKAKTSLSGTGEAAVTNRGNLLNLANSAALVAEAYGQQADSSEVGRQKLITLRQQIIDNAVAQGMNRTEVTKFIDEVMKIPKSAPPTKAQVDKAQAEKALRDFQAQVDGLRGKTVKITTIRETISYITKGDHSMQAAVNRAGIADIQGRESDGGSLRKYAGGGRIIGPGTGTNDRIRATVLQSGAQIAVSADEFLSTAASYRRNAAALEAGNRGAALSVAGHAEPIELGDATISKIGSAVERLRVRAEVSAGSFDYAMGARL